MLRSMFIPDVYFPRSKMLPVSLNGKKIKQKKLRQIPYLTDKNTTSELKTVPARERGKVGEVSEQTICNGSTHCRTRAVQKVTCRVQEKEGWGTE